MNILIKNRKKDKLLFGVGINDSEWPVYKYGRIKGKQVKIWQCPFYKRWTSMLERCYSTKYHEKWATYKHCYVCDDWLYFSNFKAWMENQDWEGKQLDKDLLIKGNMVYSPETCIFVSRQINNFLVEHAGTRGEWPIGVSLDKKWGRFLSQIAINGKHKTLGYFPSPEEAHDAWRKAKYERAVILAAEQTDERVAKALLDRYATGT